ncbi:MAG: amidohydrolase family protein [Oscillospiraceae bacterium]|nr:amidohydrolase family protein [Oscillospiraceae bacterium]
MDTLFSNISVITMDERMQVLTDAFVGITDGKISWLAKKPPEEKPETIIDGTGMVLMPGLINCHTRLSETLLRGYADDLSAEDRLGKLYPRLEQMDEKSAKASALLGIAQCLRMGVTSVSDLGLFADAVAQAAAESGIRANVAQELTLLQEDDFDFEKDPGCQKLTAVAEAWHGYDDGRILVEAGLQGTYTSCYPLWEALTEYTVNSHLGIHLNLSRFPWENEDCLDRSGLTPAQLLDCHNVFAARTQAAHCCHLEQEDMALLGRKKATAVVCSVTDRKLTAGDADIAAMVKSGMNVALGTGSAAEGGTMDLLQQARSAALCAKMKAGDPELLNAASVLLMATVCGAKAQGRGDVCGMVKPGLDADLIALDFTQPHLIPSHDLMGSVAYTATGMDVCMTMVRGKILYASGKYTTIDLSQLMTELAEHAMPTVFTQKEEPTDE